ncbi:MAG: dTMP kinase [Candidatus Micrarchaeota archaeon]|nr:dTMP kinase [Candidatus Micrarchaeota archaeon]
MAPKSGRLIVFEGIDGSGKGTQAKILEGELRRHGVRCSTYAYPDDKGEAGALLRRFLKGEFELSVEEQFLLYALDILKDQKEIEAKLAKTEVVILERYVTSTIAYQCSRGHGLRKALELVKLFGFVSPDLVIWLNIRPGGSIKRKIRQNGHGKLERFEKEKKFLGKVNEAYGKLSGMRAISKKWLRIDGRKNKKEIAKEAWASVSSL